MDEPHALVSKAARLGDRRLEWNEIDFVGWPEFRRMAPSVIGLEIGRIDTLIGGSRIGSDYYNALVRTRYALRTFIQGIEVSEMESVLKRSKHLEIALLSLSTAADQPHERDLETIRYIAHRLTYIHDRLKLIY